MDDWAGLIHSYKRLAVELVLHLEFCNVSKLEQSELTCNPFKLKLKLRSEFVIKSVQGQIQTSKEEVNQADEAALRQHDQKHRSKPSACPNYNSENKGRYEVKQPLICRWCALVQIERRS